MSSTNFFKYKYNNEEIRNYEIYGSNKYYESASHNKLSINSEFPNSKYEKEEGSLTNRTESMNYLNQKSQFSKENFQNGKNLLIPAKREYETTQDTKKISTYEKIMSRGNFTTNNGRNSLK